MLGWKAEGSLSHTNAITHRHTHKKKKEKEKTKKKRGEKSTKDEQSKNSLLSVLKKSICDHKWNISNLIMGRLLGFITSHAKQDLIKRRAAQRSQFSIKIISKSLFSPTERTHFARWFSSKSAGSNPWHKVILCWRLVLNSYINYLLSTPIV